MREAKRVVQEAAGRCLGWTAGELAAVSEQVALHPGDGGLGLGLEACPARFLASWWGAAVARAGHGDPAEVVRRSASDQSAEGRVLRAEYGRCVAHDSSLPPTLLGLADRVDEAARDPRYRSSRPGLGGVFLDRGSRRPWRTRSIS